MKVINFYVISNVMINKIILFALVLSVSGCAEIVPEPFEQSSSHINAEEAPSQDVAIPKLVEQVPILPEPGSPEVLERYTVVVNEVPVKELLFALARDAKINVDIHPEINGVVTINAVEQTLPQILKRISNQVDIRYEYDGDNLVISTDTPFIRHYKVDYINLSRDMNEVNAISTEIVSTSSGDIDGGGGGINTSSTDITSESNNNLWERLEANILSVLIETSGGADVTTNSVISSPETGTLTVQATAKQHEIIQHIIDLANDSVQRQVLIQATIVEVTLNRDYQAGINWDNIELANIGFSLAVDTLTGGAGVAAGLTNLALGTISSTTGGTIAYKDADAGGKSISATIQLLDEFGDVSVLSSPQLMALNNQTAILKVVDNLVYWTVENDATTTNGVTTNNSSSTPHSLPVGIVMSVTPYINDNSQVMLFVRPTISRTFGTGIADPLNAGSVVPQVRVREMESLLRLVDGQIGVLGGLMQDSATLNDSHVPGSQKLGFFGRLFKSDLKQYTKSELVIFLRPLIIKNPSIDGDLKEYKKYLSRDYHPLSSTSEQEQGAL